MQKVKHSVKFCKGKTCYEEYHWLSNTTDNERIVNSSVHIEGQCFYYVSKVIKGSSFFMTKKWTKQSTFFTADVVFCETKTENLINIATRNSIIRNCTY